MSFHNFLKSSDISTTVLHKKTLLLRLGYLCCYALKTWNQCCVQEGMEPVPIAGKNAIGVKREKNANSVKGRKTCNWCQVREDKQATGVKSSKTFNRCQVRENKHATVVKSGKTCNRCQVRENKQATGVKSGKTCNRCQARVKQTCNRCQVRENKQATGVKRGKTKMQPVSSAGKQTGNRCQERQNMQPVSSAAKAFVRAHDNQIKIIPLGTNMSIISLSDFKYAKERTEMGKRYWRGSLQWLRKIILNDN